MFRSGCCDKYIELRERKSITMIAYIPYLMLGIYAISAIQ